MIIVNHPEYDEKLSDYKKWRLIQEGGDAFIDEYLIKRESEEDSDFTLRKQISFNPNDAASAVSDIQYNIYQRISSEIRRIGGSDLYHKVMEGQEGGVDLENSSMTNFINRKILSELLFLGKVGVYVEAPESRGETLNKVQGHPYLIPYTAEEIVNWQYTKGQLSTLLLKENIIKLNTDGLPEGYQERYRLLKLVDGKVVVTFHNEGGALIDKDTNLPEDIQYPLEITRIPFVIFEISDSLLKNIDKAQIALLNMESSDVSWIHRSNITIFVRQTRNLNHFSKNFAEDEEISEDAPRDDTTIKVGDTQGLEYDPNTEKPGFISPSSEPLLASIQKEDKIRLSIERNLSIVLRDLSSSSAESKKESKKGMEAGLATIGTTLEYGENIIAEIFGLYTNKEPARVNYPEKWELLTDEQRREKAESIAKLKYNFPSKKAQVQFLIEQAELLLKHRITSEEFDAIKKELENSDGLVADPETIIEMYKEGVISNRLAHKLMYFPETDVQVAEDEHTERLKRIRIAQTEGAARGIKDESVDPSLESRTEKTDSQSGLD